MEVSTNELLISAVEKRPPLYDKTCDLYSNRIYLAKQWKEIGQEIGIDDASARKKWSGLRDYFLKVHKQQITTKSGSAGGSGQRKWHLYNSMLFLLPYVTDQKTCSNLSDESDHEVDGFTQMSSSFVFSTPGASTSVENNSSTIPDLGVSQEGENSDVHGSRPSSRNTGDGFANSSPQPNTTNTTTTQSRKRRYKFPQDRRQNLDSDILDAIKSMSSKPVEKNEDEEELFLKSLAPKLKSLDPLSKLECQAEMQMLLLKYMRRQATNSPQTTHPPRYSPVQPRQATDLGTVHQQAGEATTAARHYYSPRNFVAQGSSLSDGSNEYEHYQSY